VVSVRPAVSTTDQWVVTNTGCRDATFSGGVDSDGVAGVEVLTDGERSSTGKKRKRETGA
jgi:hypothetical protein